MEVMKQLKAEVREKRNGALDRIKEKVDEKKDMLHQLKEEVEGVVEDKKREALHSFKETVDEKKGMMHQLKDEVEDVVDELLSRRRHRHRSSLNSTPAANGGSTAATEYSVDSSDSEDSSDTESDKLKKVDEKSHEEIIYFDQNEGNGHQWSHSNVKTVEDLGAKVKGVDINQVLNAVIHNKELILPTSKNPDEERGEVLSTDVLEEGEEEEEVEVEFERAVEKVHNHDGYSMYCPNCSCRITKVTLRRKIKRVPIPKQTQRDDLFGCFSCFSIFVPSGERLNLFRMFGAGKGPESTPLLPQEQPTPEAPIPQQEQKTPNPITQEKGRDFDLFWIFGKRRTPVGAPEPNRVFTAGENTPENPTPGRGPAQNGNTVPVGIIEETPIKKPEGQINGGDVAIQVDDTPPVVPPISPVPDCTITDGRMTPLLQNTYSQSSRSLEIVKSIVYGGLTESITSLSVVSSAAASEATTLNIVALGLANLIGGLVVLAQNLRDLRYGDASENKYKEELGRKENFLLHATMAVLSYLVFGLIPPVVYGFTFRQSDDRDYKMLAVAAAALVCIAILSIAKAYLRREHGFMAYFKTIMFYVASAAAVSGAAYAVGDLANKLLENLGWLNPSTTVDPRLFSQAESFKPTAWASY